MFLPLLVAFYLLLHPYLGLVHDARIYTLQALNLLQPELYGVDVYLKHGSQDAYTLFSPIYAGIASALGAEHAAALITLVSTAALLAAAWWLARALMPPALAWLAVGALIIAPGFYGPDEFFEILEGFATPRLPAQALVLFAVAAWLRGWNRASVGLLGAGMLLHPIMAFCGLALLLVAWCMGHWRKAWPLLLALALALSISAIAIPGSRWQFDAAWWPVVAREDLLLLTEWNTADWARVTTVITTLVYAAVALTNEGRRLAVGLGAATVAALLVSLFAGDLLKLVIVVQAQPWRMLWLATAGSLLLLPATAAVCWRSDGLRRAGLLLLLTAWVAGHQGAAFLFSIAALLVIAFGRISLDTRASRVVVTASGIVLAVAALCVLVVSVQEQGVGQEALADAAWKPYLAAAISSVVVPGVLLLGFWLLGQRVSGGTARQVPAILAALFVGPVATAAGKPWLNERYPGSVHKAFASWRAEIPPGSDVLWATDLISGSDPTTVWLILERPSYYSSVQVNSALFSRAAAMELRRRHQSIPVVLPTENPLKVRFRSDDSHRLSCDDVPVRHVITHVEIEGAYAIPAPSGAPKPFDQLRLQVCPQR